MGGDLVVRVPFAVPMLGFLAAAVACGLGHYRAQRVPGARALTLGFYLAALAMAGVVGMLVSLIAWPGWEAVGLVFLAPALVLLGCGLAMWRDVARKLWRAAD